MMDAVFTTGVICLLTCLSSQLLKVAIQGFCKQDKLNIFSEGSYPSSHTALAMSLVISMLFFFWQNAHLHLVSEETLQMQGFLMIICFVIAGYAIRDSFGVRLNNKKLSIFSIEVCRQLSNLNLEQAQEFEKLTNTMKKELKITGHEVHEIVGGGILGILFPSLLLSIDFKNIPIFFVCIVCMILYILLSILYLKRNQYISTKARLLQKNNQQKESPKI